MKNLKFGPIGLLVLAVLAAFTATPARAQEGYTYSSFQGFSTSFFLDSWTFFSASQTDTVRMKSSRPGAEKRNATLMALLPMWVTEIDASAGMNTVAPACTSLTESLPPIRILKF